MDPLAHTLVGAALAATGLRRWAPRATPLLIVGANIPDLDAFAVLAGPEASLSLRRGWTHGPLAMLLLPVALVLVTLALDRGRWRDQPQRAGPPHAARLLLLAGLATLSHPALDWLNSYGVRLLMPFDGRWFYGDALFITDPWVWLLAGASAFLAWSATPRALAAWAVLATLASLPVLVGPMPSATRGLWLLGLAALAAARWLRPGDDAVRRSARAGLALLALYAATMLVVSRRSERAAGEWLAARGVRAERLVALPPPGRLLTRDVVAVAADRYHFVLVPGMGGALRESFPPKLRREPTPEVSEALASPQLAGTSGWLRLPDWEIRDDAAGRRLVVRDLRYAREGESGVLGGGFGVAVLPLKPAPASPPEVDRVP